MRVLLTATMAASVLALGLSMQAAQARPLGGRIAKPHCVQTVQVQHKEKGSGHARHGQRGYKGAGHGFVGSCQWLRARALTSHNPVWWRKYRQCVAR